MRPRAWARRERKSDPRVLRIDQDDQRVRVRIVPQSRLYAECFGWAACVPSTRSTLPTQVPICPASRSTQLNPGYRRRCRVPTEKPPRCCDEASFSANVGCPWSLAPGAAAWVGVDPPGVSDGKGQCGADGGRTGDAAPVRRGWLPLLGFLARRQPTRGIRGLRREGPGDLQPGLFLP